MKIGEAIHAGVTTVTKEWTTTRKKELRDAARGQIAWDRYYRGRVRERSIKEIAFEVMKQAYLKASGEGRLPATARQVMYQARPLILAETERTLGKDFDQYFTQQLLPAYLMEYEPGWDVVFDARGHLFEPHSDHQVALGTLAVRKYLSESDKNGKVLQPAGWEPGLLQRTVKTKGPAHRFRNVLFIEKEGFWPLLQEAKIAERFDLAIMSTKGVSSTAARTLMESLKGVTFYALHDFDKYGFAIVGTLQRDTWRYQFADPPEVVDLGLRLEDVQAEHLPAEPVHYQERNPRWNLFDNGATRDEVDFLVTGPSRGQRVELNAMPSDRLITWLVEKLEAHGVEKFVPAPELLEAAYRRALYVQIINAKAQTLHKDAAEAAEKADIPDDLEASIRNRLIDDPTVPWDEAVADEVDENHEVDVESDDADEGAR